MDLHSGLPYWVVKNSLLDYFHPPPHLQRGEKRKNMENTKAFPKEFTPDL